MCSYLQDEKLGYFNGFLASLGLSEFSEGDRKSWLSYSNKAKHLYICRFRNILYEAIATVFPHDVDQIYKETTTANDTTANSNQDQEQYEYLVESYKKADTWQQRRQVISVLAVAKPFKEVFKIIPDVTEHRYYAARFHAKNVRPVLPVPPGDPHRKKMDPNKLDAFLDFITSNHILRDLPYGEQRLLSDGTVHHVPNVVRCMNSSDVIHQFKVYCTENSIEPLGKL